MPKRGAAESALPAGPRRRNVREEIYNAALVSFERHGVRRTLMEDGLVAMIEASMTTIRLSAENQYIRLLTQPDTAGLTARLAESDMVMGLQRELWYPLLEVARDRGELRTDRDFDDIIRWITFLEFALISSGEVFGYATDDECRDVLSAYLVPALAP